MPHLLWSSEADQAGCDAGLSDGVHDGQFRDVDPILVGRLRCPPRCVLHCRWCWVPRWRALKELFVIGPFQWCTSQGTETLT